jgi:hypothetical protein
MLRSLSSLRPKDASSPSSRRGAVRALLAAAVACSPAIVAAQQPSARDPLITRAEATDFRETSRHADVMSVARALDAASDLVHLTTMGYSLEGRELPLLVVGRVPNAGPEAVRASGLLRVYLQGNIHAGEVEGKEVLQMLVRDIVRGAHPEWLQQMVLLVGPIYNPDGNERVTLTNRGQQHGPVGGMGQRPNAQNYDLNRDHMKLDAPETRSLLGMLAAYDPQMGMDLHTTNGSRHAYHLTYAPPLHPGVDAGIVSLLRSDWLPEVTRRIRDRYRWEFYYYGNVTNSPDGQRWQTFDHRPRFNNNYFGLRNRVAILSEAYSYATFEERVRATYAFVEEVLTFAATNRRRIEDAVSRADREVLVGRVLPTRATFARTYPQQVQILMGATAEERNPYSGAVMLRRLDEIRPTPMWEYGTFSATDSARVPAAYYVPAELTAVVERLAAHGVRTERLARARTETVEAFMIDSTRVAEQPFQGHRERTVFGSYRAVSRNLPAGTVAVDVAQPLGRLAFYLLEPRSDDGLLNWGFMDDALSDGYPITRRPAP